MKRLALLLPLLALAAAPARAEYPATNAAPALEEVEGPVVSVRPEDFVEDDAEDVERFPRPGLAGHRALHAHWTRVVREWGREPRPGDRAAALAMRWLESRQGADGSWGGGDVSATSLALLVRLRTPADAFLEAVPPRDARADAAARFLLSSLGPDGAFRPADADGSSRRLSACSRSRRRGTAPDTTPPSAPPSRTRPRRCSPPRVPTAPGAPASRTRRPGRRRIPP